MHRELPQASYPASVQEWGEWPTCSPSGDLTLASGNEDPSFKRSPVFSVNGLIFLVTFSHSCYVGIQCSVPFRVLADSTISWIFSLLFFFFLKNFSVKGGAEGKNKQKRGELTLKKGWAFGDGLASCLQSMGSQRVRYALATEQPLL